MHTQCICTAIVSISTTLITVHTEYAVTLIACRTNYHHNYTVQAGIRTYYGGVPDIIQVGEHQFVERRVLELFASQVLLSWTSATNSARIYDLALSQRDLASPLGAKYSLRTEQVWDGYVLLALLRDFAFHDGFLRLPHTGDQRDRFTTAMQDRNARMRRAGQPEWAHYCDRCTSKYQDDDGRWRESSRPDVF